MMNYTETSLNNLKQKALKLKSVVKPVFKKLKKNPPKNLDSVTQELHEDVFSRIDCLSCANCCKTLGPRISYADIVRLAKFLRIKPGKFITDYLKIDEDGDYVFKEMPCPFLMSDNYCMVYEVRPKACREYPHTNRKRFYQALDISIKNMETCPAVYDIIEKLEKIYR